MAGKNSRSNRVVSIDETRTVCPVLTEICKKPELVENIESLARISAKMASSAENTAVRCPFSLFPCLNYCLSVPVCHNVTRLGADEAIASLERLRRRAREQAPHSDPLLGARCLSLVPSAAALKGSMPRLRTSTSVVSNMHESTSDRRESTSWCHLYRRLIILAEPESKPCPHL